MKRNDNRREEKNFRLIKHFVHEIFAKEIDSCLTD